MTEAKEDELDEEAEWIYNCAFVKQTISLQVMVNNLIWKGNIEFSSSLPMKKQPRIFKRKRR